MSQASLDVELCYSAPWNSCDGKSRSGRLKYNVLTVTVNGKSESKDAPYQHIRALKYVPRLHYVADVQQAALS